MNCMINKLADGVQISVDSELQILSFLKEMISRSPKWKIKLNELGCTSILSVLFRKRCETPSSNVDSRKFSVLVELLEDLLTLHENATTFSLSLEISLFELLNHESCHPSICKLFTVWSFFNARP